MRFPLMFCTLCLTIAAMNGAARGQDLPPIFADTPKQIVKATTLTEFPVNTFLENILVDKDGIIFVTTPFRASTD